MGKTEYSKHLVSAFSIELRDVSFFVTGSGREKHLFSIIFRQLCFGQYKKHFFYYFSATSINILLV